MNTLYVEGIADKKFLEDFISYLDHPGVTTLKIISINGYQKLVNFENTIQQTIDFKGKNLIVFDSDDNKAEKIFEINRIENKLHCNIPYFFFPNDSNNGCLEDLLINIINPKHQIIFDCFQQYQSCLEKNGNYMLPNKKAMIYAYCEAILPYKEKEKVKENKRDYLNTELWKIDTDYLLPLKTFIEDNIIE